MSQENVELVRNAFGGAGHIVRFRAYYEPEEALEAVSLTQ
jgi:hypothetical protein